MKKDASQHASPKEVVTDLIRAFGRGDLDAVLALYADDVEISVLFDFPTKSVLSGKKRLIDAFSTFELGRMYDNIRIEGLWVAEAEPGIAVGEWTYVSTIGDAEVENANVIIVKVVDGKIVWSRDYHNHVTRAVADGNLDQTLESIARIPLP